VVIKQANTVKERIRDGKPATTDVRPRRACGQAPTFVGSHQVPTANWQAAQASPASCRRSSADEVDIPAAVSRTRVSAAGCTRANGAGANVGRRSVEGRRIDFSASVSNRYGDDAPQDRRDPLGPHDYGRLDEPNPASPQCCG
jgi:hypothetical protein